MYDIFGFYHFNPFKVFVPFIFYISNSPLEFFFRYSIFAYLFLSNIGYQIEYLKKNSRGLLLI